MNIFNIFSTIAKIIKNLSLIIETLIFILENWDNEKTEYIKPTLNDKLHKLKSVK